MLTKTAIGLLIAPWVLCSLCVLGADEARARAGVGEPLQQAPKPRVVLTTLTMHGVTRADRRTLIQSLLGGLSGAGLHVITQPRAHKTLAGRASLLGCETSVCLKAIGDLLHAPLCARAVVEDAGGGTYRIALTLTETGTGQQVTHQVKHCAPCTTAEAAESLSRAAKAAGLKAMSVIPATPARRTARHPPPRRRRQAPATGRRRPGGAARNSTFTIAGIALIATGVVAIVPGATLWALDGRDRPNRDPALERRQVWDTKVLGVTATAVGAAALATGVGLLVYGLLRKRRGREPLVLTIGPRAGGAVLMGKFYF